MLLNLYALFMFLYGIQSGKVLLKMESIGTDSVFKITLVLSNHTCCMNGISPAVLIY